MTKYGFLMYVFCGSLLYEAAAILRGANSRVRNGVYRTSRCRGVSYADLGCFTLDPPFNNTSWLPQSPSYINTVFLLYTPANPSRPYTLSAKSRFSIAGSPLDSSLPVKMLVHGFLQYAGSPFLINTTRALLENAAVNVIVVSWGNGAGFPYSRAVANTRVVAAETAKLIRALSKIRGVRRKQVHIVGHSLGAHIAGYVGSRIPGLGRITGLDPAQPNFSGTNRAVRLDSSDARFVDVIHTDAVRYNTVDGYGIIEPVGHIDFYPNGGNHQPGCYDEPSFIDLVADAWRRGVTTVEYSMTCSHERSTQLFTASIGLNESQCTFTAYPCQSEENFTRGECLHCGNRPCPIMGLEADRSFRSRGVFYLNTTGSAPYCGHHYFVFVTLEPGMNNSGGVISVRLTGTGGTTPWTSSRSGPLSGGDVIHLMMIIEENVEEIHNVDLKFSYDPSYFTWNSDVITLKKVDVSNVMKFPMKYFCQPNMIIRDREEIALNRGTYAESECQ